MQMNTILFFLIATFTQLSTTAPTPRLSTTPNMNVEINEVDVRGGVTSFSIAIDPTDTLGGFSLTAQCISQFNTATSNVFTKIHPTTRAPMPVNFLNVFGYMKGKFLLNPNLLQLDSSTKVLTVTFSQVSAYNIIEEETIQVQPPMACYKVPDTSINPLPNVNFRFVTFPGTLTLTPTQFTDTQIVAGTAVLTLTLSSDGDGWSRHAFTITRKMMGDRPSTQEPRGFNALRYVDVGGSYNGLQLQSPRRVAPSKCDRNAASKYNITAYCTLPRSQIMGPANYPDSLQCCLSQLPCPTCEMSQLDLSYTGASFSPQTLKWSSTSSSVCQTVAVVTSAVTQETVGQVQIVSRGVSVVHPFQLTVKPKCSWLIKNMPSSLYVGQTGLAVMMPYCMPVRNMKITSITTNVDVKPSPVLSWEPYVAAAPIFMVTPTSPFNSQAMVDSTASPSDQPQADKYTAIPPMLYTALAVPIRVFPRAIALSTSVGSSGTITMDVQLLPFAGSTLEVVCTASPGGVKLNATQLTWMSNSSSTSQSILVTTESSTKSTTTITCTTTSVAYSLSPSTIDVIIPKGKLNVYPSTITVIATSVKGTDVWITPSMLPPESLSIDSASSPFLFVVPSWALGSWDPKPLSIQYTASGSSTTSPIRVTLNPTSTAFEPTTINVYVDVPKTVTCTVKGTSSANVIIGTPTKMSCTINPLPTCSMCSVPVFQYRLSTVTFSPPQLTWAVGSSATQDVEFVTNSTFSPAQVTFTSAYIDITQPLYIASVAKKTITISGTPSNLMIRPPQLVTLTITLSDLPRDQVNIDVKVPPACVVSPQPLVSFTSSSTSTTATVTLGYTGTPFTASTILRQVNFELQGTSAAEYSDVEPLSIRLRNKFNVILTKPADAYLSLPSDHSTFVRITLEVLPEGASTFTLTPSSDNTLVTMDPTTITWSSTSPFDQILHLRVGTVINPSSVQISFVGSSDVYETLAPLAMSLTTSSLFSPYIPFAVIPQQVHAIGHGQTETIYVMPLRVYSSQVYASCNSPATTFTCVYPTGTSLTWAGGSPPSAVKLLVTPPDTLSSPAIQLGSSGGFSLTTNIPVNSGLSRVVTCEYGGSSGPVSVVTKVVYKMTCTLNLAAEDIPVGIFVIARLSRQNTIFSPSTLRWGFDDMTSALATDVYFVATAPMSSLPETAQVTVTTNSLALPGDPLTLTTVAPYEFSVKYSVPTLNIFKTDTLTITITPNAATATKAVVVTISGSAFPSFNCPNTVVTFPSNSAVPQSFTLTPKSATGANAFLTFTLSETIEFRAPRGLGVSVRETVGLKFEPPPEVAPVTANYGGISAFAVSCDSLPLLGTESTLTLTLDVYQKGALSSSTVSFPANSIGLGVVAFSVKALVMPNATADEVRVGIQTTSPKGYLAPPVIPRYIGQPRGFRASSSQVYAMYNSPASLIVTPTSTPSVTTKLTSSGLTTSDFSLSCTPVLEWNSGDGSSRVCSVSVLSTTVSSGATLQLTPNVTEFVSSGLAITINLEPVKTVICGIQFKDLHEQNIVYVGATYFMNCQITPNVPCASCPAASVKFDHPGLTFFPTSVTWLSGGPTSHDIRVTAGSVITPATDITFTVINIHTPPSLRIEVKPSLTLTVSTTPSDPSTLYVGQTLKVAVTASGVPIEQISVMFPAADTTLPRSAYSINGGDSTAIMTWTSADTNAMLRKEIVLTLLEPTLSPATLTLALFGVSMGEFSQPSQNVTNIQITYVPTPEAAWDLYTRSIIYCTQYEINLGSVIAGNKYKAKRNELITIDTDHGGGKCKCFNGTSVGPVTRYSFSIIKTVKPSQTMTRFEKKKKTFTLTALLRRKKTRTQTLLPSKPPTTTPPTTTPPPNTTAPPTTTAPTTKPPLPPRKKTKTLSLIRKQKPSTKTKTLRKPVNRKKTKTKTFVRGKNLPRTKTLWPPKKLHTRTKKIPTKTFSLDALRTMSLSPTVKLFSKTVTCEFCGVDTCKNDTYCNSHASAVSSKDGGVCSCSCMAPYSGARCNTCNMNRINYPVCTPCSNQSHCSNHALTITNNTNQTKCMCNCLPSYTGEDCSRCAVGFVKYPTCERCTSSQHCNGHAYNVTSDVTVSKCLCKCLPQYKGTACDECADGLKGYPACYHDIPVIPSASELSGKAVQSQGSIRYNFTLPCCSVKWGSFSNTGTNVSIGNETSSTFSGLIITASDGFPSNIFDALTAKGKQFIHAYVDPSGYVLTLELSGLENIDLPRREQMQFEFTPTSFVPPRASAYVTSVQVSPILLEPVFAPETKQQAQTMVTTGSALALSVPTANSATQAGKINAIIATMNCMSDEAVELDFMSHPTQIMLGSGDDIDPDVLTYWSAMIGNTFIVFTCLLAIHSTGVCVLWIMGSESFTEQLSRCRFPTIFVILIMFFYQPTVTAAWYVILYSGSVGMTIAAIIVELLLLSAIGVMLYPLFGVNFEAKWDLDEDEYEHKVQQEPTQVHRWWFKVSEPRGEWIDAKLGSGFVRRYVLYFEDFNPERRWFGIVDTLFVHALGIVSAVKPTHEMDCEIISAAMCICYFVYLMAFFAWRPYNTPFNAFFVAASAVLQFCATLLGMLGHITGSDSDMMSAIPTACLLTDLALFILKTFVDGVLTGMALVARWKDARESDMERKLFGGVGDDMEATITEMESVNPSTRKGAVSPNGESLKPFHIAIPSNPLKKMQELWAHHGHGHGHGLGEGTAIVAPPVIPNFAGTVTEGKHRPSTAVKTDPSATTSVVSYPQFKIGGEDEKKKLLSEL